MATSPETTRRDAATGAEAVRVSQNLLRAHAAAVAVYRAEAKGQIGLVVNLVPVHPATESDADRVASQRMDAYVNRHFLDPALLGSIPEELPEMFGPSWHSIDSDDLARLRQPIDFVGVNYYLRIHVRDDPTAGPPRAQVVSPPDSSYTAMGWEIDRAD